MKSLFSVFKKGLQKTATKITRTVSNVFTDAEEWSDDSYEDLEDALITSDFGVNITMKVIDDIRDRYDRGLIKTTEEILQVARDDVKEILTKDSRDINYNTDGLTVILLVGVNGSGKTTTAGKLAHIYKEEGKSVMLAACDTFRAAAVDQLKLWGERTDCHVVSAKHGADPAAVAYDAVKSALAKNTDILIIDTAGRQHNKKGLMDELAKVCRSIDKVYPNAPQETLLTIDSSMGSNALAQAKEFIKTSNVSGLVLTKLDGTGKGGMAVAIQNEFNIPLFFVGLGEQLDDLQPFDAENYTNALFE